MNTKVYARRLYIYEKTAPKADLVIHNIKLRYYQIHDWFHKTNQLFASHMQVSGG